MHVRAPRLTAACPSSQTQLPLPPNLPSPLPSSLPDPTRCLRACAAHRYVLPAFADPDYREAAVSAPPKAAGAAAEEEDITLLTANYHQVRDAARH